MKWTIHITLWSMRLECLKSSSNTWWFGKMGLTVKQVFMGNRNFRSQELSLPGISLLGTKMPWNFRSQERKWRWTFAPGSEKVLEHSFSGTKMTWNVRSQSEYTHATQRSGIIFYQTVTARMSPKYSWNPRADFTQRHSLHSWKP